MTRLGDDSLLLDVEAGSGAAVAARLGRFKLRAKFDLEPLEWSGPCGADVAGLDRQRCAR